MAGRWAWFGIRVVLGTLVALVLIYWPLPVPLAHFIGSIRVPAIIIISICYIGKLLYDTLYYDHYRP